MVVVEVIGGVMVMLFIIRVNIGNIVYVLILCKLVVMY